MNFLVNNKKIIAIGLCSDQKRNIFSGQAMMFEALTHFLKEEQFDVSIINLTSQFVNIQVGKIALKRIIEYFIIILRSIPVFFRNRRGILYITTAQTKGGFLRDLVFINFAVLTGCKVLIQQFGSNFGIFYESLSPIFKYLVRSTFNKGEYIIVEGEFTKRQFAILKNYSVKVIAITNGLPERNLKISNIGKSYNESEPFRLIYLSYMIESKGYWDVLEAMDILINKSNRNVNCVFAGMFKSSVDDVRFTNETEATQAFHSYIELKNLKGKITYYGGLMGEDKANAFKKTHVFLLPSYFKFEGQPVSVLEAMAYGAVPIVTNYRMIPNMVTSECGIFVEAKSPHQIATKIEYLIDNPEIFQNLSQSAVNRFQDNFTLDKYCSNILQLINVL